MENIIEISFWIAAKWFVVIGLLLYLVFAFVIVKQANMMTNTLQIGFKNLIKYFAYLHFLLAIGILILAFLIL